MWQCKFFNFLGFYTRVSKTDERLIGSGLNYTLDLSTKHHKNQTISYLPDLKLTDVNPRFRCMLYDNCDWGQFSLITTKVGTQSSLLLPEMYTP